MFRKIAFVFAAGLFLSACAGGVTSPVAQKIAANISAATTKVVDTAATVKAKAQVAQTYAQKICGFVPTIASVIGIINSGFSADVEIVANAVCNAVTSVPLADGPGDHLPRVNGVVVRGKFVK